MIEKTLNSNIHHTREEVRNHFSKQFLEYILENGHDFKSSLNNVIDGGYCYGYNIVLEAVEEVFGGLTENYWKVVNKLQEWEETREKELEENDK